MKLRNGWMLVAFALAGCSGNDGKITVESSNQALTDSGGDKLFTITLAEARDGGYALDGIKVKVTPDGKDAIEVTCSVADANSNQKLDKDEKLTCVEPADNKLGKDLADKECDVELFAKIDDKDERVGDATWTPPK